MGCNIEVLVINFVREARGPRVIDELGAWENKWSELKFFAGQLSRLALANLSRVREFR